MAKTNVGTINSGCISKKSKKTRQGQSQNTHFGATSRNGKRKSRRGQG
jgi:hypothetical protein